MNNEISINWITLEHSESCVYIIRRDSDIMALDIVGNSHTIEDLEIVPCRSYNITVTAEIPNNIIYGSDAEIFERGKRF